MGFLFASALTGSVLATLFLVSGVHRFWWFSGIVYLAGSGLIVRLAFGKTTKSAWIKNLLFYYLSSYLLSGVLNRLQVIANRQGSGLLLLAGAIFTLLMARKLVPFFCKEGEKQAQIFPIRLCRNGRMVSGRGFLDTGNRLKDPFSGKPVVVGTRSFLQTFLKEEELLLRYIPFHTVGIEGGMIAVFCVDYIEIQSGKGDWNRTEKQWIAVSDNRISTDGEFDVILPSEILKILKK